MNAMIHDDRSGAFDALTATAWDALGEVLDPELPVVSIIELGIVRDVTCGRDECVVTVTPTYSGCPATRVIEAEVRAAVSRVTDRAVRIQIALTPAWSTDWIAPEARATLAAAGIAPPGEAKAASSTIVLREAIRCPHCGSLATEELARFGSTACKAQYRCRDCREPFDYFKPH